ncbi:antibiotic biosynthesis monooxygenase [Burkholderia arboris]|uniref:Antibiotic biosynthesis monooxygenase n=1 Tax=Burkholderia arboris TaxID=488730 RepID=A0A9Q9SJ44_9BURK|nr:antibiotic biosynthesis monooxygenase [Burkholderia arboris]VWB65434.1 hypothetical protein BAR24066_03043 [Burkholderia arboris]
MNEVDRQNRNNKNEVLLIISRRIVPGKRHEQIAAYEHLASVVRAEPGCLQYDRHPVVGDEDRLC